MFFLSTSHESMFVHTFIVLNTNERRNSLHRISGNGLWEQENEVGLDECCMVVIKIFLFLSCLLKLYRVFLVKNQGLLREQIRASIFFRNKVIHSPLIQFVSTRVYVILDAKAFRYASLQFCEYISFLL